MDVPIDYCFLDVLLRAAHDPEVGLGEYAQGVKVGPGTRMPRLPAQYKPKKKWRLPSQVDPLDYLEYAPDKSGVWRSNYATLREFETQVLDVMHDQASRGQIIVMTESEAKSRYPDLVVASLGAQRKQKPGGKVTARVLFDGTAWALCEFQNKAQGPRKGADRGGFETLDERKIKNRRAHFRTLG